MPPKSFFTVAQLTQSLVVFLVCRVGGRSISILGFENAAELFPHAVKNVSSFAPKQSTDTKLCLLTFVTTCCSMFETFRCTKILFQNQQLNFF